MRSGCLTSTDACLNDGYIITGIKGQVAGFNKNLNTILGSYLGIDHGSTNSVKAGPNDGLIAILAKSMTEIIVTNVYNGFNDISNKLVSIGANGNYYDTTSCVSGDGALTCMIKAQNRLILNSLENLYASLQYFKANNSYYTSGCTTGDGTFTCLIKAQTYLVIEQLKKISISSGGQVIDYQAKLDLITKKLDDLIKKVGDISLTPSGTTIWDFLKELVRGVTTVLDGILDFLNNITDLIRDIVIPSDVSFITTEFNRINDKLSAKFSLVSTLSTTITTSFNVKESNLLAKDFTVTFPAYGSMTLLNVTYLNSVLPYAKRILSAVLYLLTAIYAYKKITNRMVE